MKKIDIPEFLRHLPVDPRGYPVPYFVPIRNGQPEFLYADERKVSNCVERRLCGICGKIMLNGNSYMISGPIGYKNRVASDAPMHKQCAEYSLRVCPHMYHEKAERRSEAGDDIVHVREKPPYLLLVQLEKYGQRYDKQAGYKLIHYIPTGEPERYDYQNGILTKS